MLFYSILESTKTGSFEGTRFPITGNVWGVPFNPSSATPVSQIALQHIKFPQCILVNAWLKKGGHWRTVLSFFSIKVCTVANSKGDLDLEQKLGIFFKKLYVLVR